MPAHYLEFLLLGFGLVLLLVEAFVPLRDKSFIGKLAAAGLLVAFGLLFAIDRNPVQSDVFANYYHVDAAALFFKGIAILTTFCVVLLGLDFLPVLKQGINGASDSERTSQGGIAEFFSLPIFACAGLMWMASAKDLITMFVALETVTITFYVMVSSMRRNVGSLEAGVKYLILGALSTGVLVFGMAWVFGATGTLSLEVLTNAGPEQWATWSSSSALLFGVALVLISLGFKVGAVPMQVWIPDVYQGAPTPITGFLSVGSKAAGFIVLWRFVQPFLGRGELTETILLILAVMTAATLLVGNLAALGQSNFKRLLAYSSIAHAGFLLLGLVAGTPLTVLGFYLGAYLLMTFLAFAVLAIVRVKTGSDELVAFNGLAKRSPFLAFALVVAVSSLAGVPGTAGFIGKFLIIMGTVSASAWVLLGFAVLGAASGFYYYLKVLRNVFWLEGSEDSITVTPLTKAFITVLIAAIFFFGIYPKPIFDALGVQTTETATELVSQP
ncbi:NADH-quinone oxidoreductase subunit N [Sulfuriroseicoccus oceanibius]|uniref:NADH-quinone oxidoreductase subunit N n=1 Tax=Sulfuriroseicoccus oceanibius TaxID=2707525 RepID=A0A6B3L1X1_9BACT|nr:NADH-quinone oxidoreductase subunit N [Sulfuriroseicoccus oceanibius]QQL44273.1 NADH-quinone oxidoreductase subunit N [Sulfuriroseicoccus oceanibius]